MVAFNILPAKSFSRLLRLNFLDLTESNNYFVLCHPEEQLTIKTLDNRKIVYNVIKQESLDEFLLRQTNSGLDLDSDRGQEDCDDAIAQFWQDIEKNLDKLYAVSPNAKMTFFVYLDSSKAIANTYALGHLLYNNVAVDQAIYTLAHHDLTCDFDYATSCVLDELLNFDGKLLDKTLAYEATGIVVSTDGRTLVKES